MKYAIHSHTISSIFQDSTEKSKQTSQLLFGEVCTIKSEREDFYYIENFSDRHCGWILKSALLLLSEVEAEKLKAAQPLRVCMPLVDIFNLKDKTVWRLPAGSSIPNYDPESNKFILGDLEFQIHSSFISYLPYGNLEGIVEVALSFRNTPFMFGGKSVLGIDEAGFVQLVYSLCGYSIPRTMVEQAKIGAAISSTKELQKGDLVFVSKNNILTDVFIYLHDYKLIGVSSKVQIVNLEELEQDGSRIIIRRFI